MQAESWKEETQEVILGITVASAGVRMSTKLSRSRRLTWNVQGARDSKSFTSGLFRASTNNMMWNVPFAMAQESFPIPPESRTIAPLVANLSALGRRGAIAINQQSNLSKF